MKYKLLISCLALLTCIMVTLTACSNNKTVESNSESEVISQIEDLVQIIKDDVSSISTIEDQNAQPSITNGNTYQATSGAIASSVNLSSDMATIPKPQNHSPIYKQQWVIDKAAWTETVPVYTQKSVSICTSCNADITGTTSSH